MRFLMFIVGLLVGGILGGVFGYLSLVVTDDRGSYGGFVVVYAMILYGIVFAVIGGAKPKEMKSFMLPIIIMIFTVFIFYNFFYDNIYLTVIYLMIVATISLYRIKKIVKHMSSIIVVMLITILPLYLIFHSHIKDVPNIKKMYFKIEGEKELLQKVHINIQYMSYDAPVIYTIFHNGVKFKDNFYAHQYGFYVNYDNHLYAKFVEDQNNDYYLNNNTLNFLKKDSDIYLNCKKSDEKKCIKLEPLEAVTDEYTVFQTIGATEIRDNNQRRSFFYKLYSIVTGM